MKKRIFYVLLILMFSFSFVNNVFAEEFEVSVVNNNGAIPKGGEASFKVNLKSSEIIAECLFNVEAEGDLEYVSASGANGWQVSMVGTKGINLSNSNMSTNINANGANIMEIKYKVNSDGRVVLKTSECVSLEDEKTYNYANIGVNFTVEEVDDTTINVTATNGAVNQNGNQYIINLKSTSFGLDITANNSSYQDKIVVKDKDGNEIKDVSKMTFADPTGQGIMYLTVTVNNKMTYDILVKYEEKDYDNSLKSITINGKELELVEGQYSYTYKVPKDTESVEVSPTLMDNENFELAGNYAGKNIFSDNVIHVVIDVVPKDTSSGAKKITYNIEIQKEGSTPPPSSGNSGNTGSVGNGSNINKNPTTSDMPMFLMGFILIVSLLGSVMLYQKNLQSYK